MEGSDVDDRDTSVNGEHIIAKTRGLTRVKYHGEETFRREDAAYSVKKISGLCLEDPTVIAPDELSGAPFPLNRGPVRNTLVNPSASIRF